MENFKHPLHLKIPELQTSDEVTDAVAKQERLTGEDLPNDPAERLEAYMARLEKVFLNPDERVKERNLEMLRPAIYDAYIIKPQDVPESYFELQQQVARERGQPVEVIPPNVREQMITTAIEDQRHSLDQWIDYLTSEDATYPTWFKYFVFRNILKLSQYDKTLGKFKDRTQTTVAPYPDVYREPLAQICDLYEQVEKDNTKLKDPEVQALFSKRFPKLYAELITKSLAASMEGKEQIQGEWIKYEQDKAGEAERLYQSLEGKGTGWCTAGHSTAETQIKQGDFYVYYTYNTNNEPTQPRIAIRMNGTTEIGEVRGIQAHQSLEPQMQEVLDEKLKDFGPEADKYRKKSADMKHLTEIDKKTQANETLNRADLLFLYEIDSSIEGFGYRKDPRIAEILSKRNLPEDLPHIFNCELNQIATSLETITPDTVVYIGVWNPMIMNQLPRTTEYIYSKFSTKEKERVCFKISPDPEITSADSAITKLINRNYRIEDEVRENILPMIDWTEKLKPVYEVVSFSIGELFGNSGAQNHTYAEIKAMVEIQGLDFVPQALAPSIRLNYPPNGQLARLAMNPVYDREGRNHFNVLACNWKSGNAWLDYDGGGDYDGWYITSQFFFVRK